MKYVLLCLIFSLQLSGQTTQRIDSLSQISHQDLISNLEKNETVFENAIKEANSIKYEKGIAKLEERLAIIKYYLKKTEEGVALSVSAGKYYKQLNDTEGLANIKSDIGWTIKYIQPEQAIQYFKEAIKLVDTLPISLTHEKIFNNYGVLLAQNNELDSALIYHKKAYNIAKSLNKKMVMPYSLNNIALVESMRNNFDKALLALDESDLYRSADTTSIQWAENLVYRADVFYNKEDYNNAVKYYKNSLRLAERNNFVNLKKYCLQYLSNCYEKKGNTKHALAYQKHFINFKDSIESLELSVSISKLKEEFESAIKDKEIAEKSKQLKEAELKKESIQKDNIILFSVLTILFLSAIIVYIILRNKQKKLKQNLNIQQIEAKNKLQEEKLRISRELHDNIGSQLTYVASSLDNLNYIKSEENKEIKRKEIEAFTKNTISELRETVWSMKAENITWQDLLSRISAIAKRYKENSAINITVNNPNQNTNVLDTNAAINILRITQEAINNAVKYSEASHIEVKLTNNQLIIKDNGVGFESNNTNGNGLENMQYRAKEIKADLQIKSEVNVGSTITLNL